MKRFILLCLFVPIIMTAQYERQWQNIYHDGNHSPLEVTRETAQLPDGGIVTVASIIDIKLNTLLRRISPTGMERWSHFYTGEAEITPLDVITTMTGKIALALRQEDSTGTFNIRTIYYEADGTVIWDKTFDSAPFFSDEPYKLASDQNGGIYVLGYFGPGVGVIHYPANGSEGWIKSFSKPSAISEIPLSIVMNSDGSGYVTGNVSDSIKVYKFANNGDILWSKSTDLHTTDNGKNCLLVDDRENVMVFGHSSQGYTVIRFDSSGINNGRFDYGTPATEWNNAALQILQKQNGNIVLLGESFIPAEAKYRVYIIQLSENLTEDWVADELADSSSQAPVYPVMTTTDSDTIYYSGSYNHLFVNSVDNRGNVKSVLQDTLSTATFYIANHIQVNKDNAILLDGFFSRGMDRVLFSTLYQQDIVDAISPGIRRPLNFELYQNYPNPFNGTTQIDFAIANPGMVTLDVFNVTGKKVGTLFHGYMESGKHRVRFRSPGLSSGIYFYTLRSGFFQQTRKLILVK